MMIGSRTFVAMLALVASHALGCADVEGTLDDEQEERGDEETAVKQQALTNCQPRFDQIAIFRGENFGGECIVLGVGAQPRVWAAGDISSIRVGDSMMARVCTGSDFQGTCDFVEQSTGAPGVWNNATLSLNVMYKRWDIINVDPYYLGAGVVVLKANSLDWGVPFSKQNHDTLAMAGEYAGSELVGVARRTLDQVILGRHTRLRVCTEPSLRGDCREYQTGPAAQTRFDMGAWGQLGRDRVQSLRITRLQ